MDAAWWSIVTRRPEGVGGGSIERERVGIAPKFDVVWRLRLLGFFLGLGSGGLTKAAGDAGAEACTNGSSDPSFSASPFAFLGFLGSGDVIGRSNESPIMGLSDMVRSSREWIPKPVEEKDDKGSITTGDSGDELGDGSVRAEESAVEMVEVGDESVDSDACVDVLSRCLCCASGEVTALSPPRCERPLGAISDFWGDSAKVLSMSGALQV